MSNKSDNSMILNDEMDSSSPDGGSSGVSFSQCKDATKKGPWTSVEDAILVDYVKKHGEGNWNAVQKHSGLSRCGKSCRLRWANHLRPNLKKGAFTAEEEQKIIELHRKFGNKWARMATHLPGRTDNEIKNYWNTRVKRRKRAGLPDYPPHLSLNPASESQQNQSTCEFRSGDKQQNEIVQPSIYKSTNVLVNIFKANQGTLSYAPFPGSMSYNMLDQELGSHYGFMTPTNHSELLCESQMLIPNSQYSLNCGFPAFEQFPNENSAKIHRPFGMGFPYDPDPGSYPDSHALLRGNFSASQPLHGIVKPELPSLQYPGTDPSIWYTRPLASPVAEVDVIVESTTTVLSQSECFSQRNSGLLECMLQQSHLSSSSKNQPSEKNSSSATPVSNDMVESSPPTHYNTECDSPLGGSTASVFSECMPPTIGGLLDARAPGNPYGLNVKLEPADPVPATNMEENEMPHLGFSMHDALPGSEWYPGGQKDPFLFDKFNICNF